MNKNNNSLITSNIIVSVQIYPIRSFKKKKKFVQSTGPNKVHTVQLLFL